LVGQQRKETSKILLIIFNLFVMVQLVYNLVYDNRLG
jgi:hypothetical protein